MNRNILFAGILSMVAIFGTVSIYNTYFAPESPPAESVTAEGRDKTGDPAAPETAFEGPVPLELKTESPGAAAEVVWENDLFMARFSTRGAVLTSFMLKGYGGDDLIWASENAPLPLSLKLGGMDAPVLDRVFSVDRRGDALRFSALLTGKTGEEITLEKTITFSPDEYLMKVDISLTGDRMLPVTAKGTAYTLELGPQIGPAFEDASNRNNYRHFLVSRGGAKSNFRPPEGGIAITEPDGPWIGVEGRYFTAFLICPDIPLRLAWDDRPLPDLEIRRSAGVLRQGEGAKSLKDSYYLYIGPKSAKILGRYDRGEDNSYGLAGAGLSEIAGQSGIFFTLGRLVGAILSVLFLGVRNYGLAVILLALVVEAALIPLKRKNAETNARMRLYSSEITAIKRECGRDKQKTMKRVGEFYASKNLTPRPATRSLLVHLPVFLGLYFLFSTSIEFRQALFVPGLFPDLSSPDSLLSFAPAKMPITNWSDLRLLPLLVLGITLFQSRRVQPPVDAFGSMRTMSILMPIMILLVIYNMPSGAVLYWFTHTVAATAYQMWMNRKVERAGEISG